MWHVHYAESSSYGLFPMVFQAALILPGSWSAQKNGGQFARRLFFSLERGY
jgi:hypothetical protein